MNGNWKITLGELDEKRGVVQVWAAAGISDSEFNQIALGLVEGLIPRKDGIIPAPRKYP